MDGRLVCFHGKRQAPAQPRKIRWILPRRIWRVAVGLRSLDATLHLDFRVEAADEADVNQLKGHLFLVDLDYGWNLELNVGDLNRGVVRSYGRYERGTKVLGSAQG